MSFCKIIFGRVGNCCLCAWAAVVFGRLCLPISTVSAQVGSCCMLSGEQRFLCEDNCPGSNVQLSGEQRTSVVTAPYNCPGSNASCVVNTRSVAPRTIVRRGAEGGHRGNAGEAEGRFLQNRCFLDGVSGGCRFVKSSSEGWGIVVCVHGRLWSLDDCVCRYRQYLRK